MGIQILTIASFALLSLLSFQVEGRTWASNRVKRDVASTLAVDSFGTPIMTTGLDAMGVTQEGAIGAGLGPVIDPYALGTGAVLGNGAILGNGGIGLFDTSAIGTDGVWITATSGEAVGNYYELSAFYSFLPVASTAPYVLPPNLQAYRPDIAFLTDSPPTAPCILACDLLGTGMCYYYYF